MARKQRIHYPHAYYHVMLRGNYRQNIFHTDAHRIKFLEQLKACVIKYNCKIHLFCLMTNHIHLLIEVNTVPLSRIMQSLSTAYACYVNRQLNKSGHVFQGRYKAKLVHDTTYLLELCFYIHNNPVSAKIVGHIDDYKWSSHLCYMGSQPLSWLTTERINEALMTYMPNEANTYQQFICEKQNQDLEPQFFSIDDEGCIIIKDSVNPPEKIQLNNDLSVLSIADFINVICNEMQIDPSQISEPNYKREICIARSLITYCAHYYGKHTIINVALYFNQDSESVSKRMYEHIKKGKLQKHMKPMTIALKIEKLEKLAKLEAQVVSE